MGEHVGDIGRMIGEARIEVDLTQADLASRAGTSQGAVARYEAGTTSPSIRTLERLLRAAGQRLRIEVDEAPQPPAVLIEAVRELRRCRQEVLAAVRSCGAYRPVLVTSEDLGAPAVETAIAPSVVLVVRMEPPYESSTARMHGLAIELAKAVGYEIPVAAIPPRGQETAARAEAHGVPF